MMKKLLYLSIGVLAGSAFVLAGAFSDAEAGQGKGRKKTNAIAGSAEDLVACIAGSPTSTIQVGSDASQCYTYILSLTNLAHNTVAHEVISSNFDLSGDAEDEANDGIGDAIDELDADTGAGGAVTDNSCQDPNAAPGNFVMCGTIVLADAEGSAFCVDGSCDGIVLGDGCDDGDCDGIAVFGEVGGTCTVNWARPDSAVKKNSGAIPPKQPEILNIEVASDNGTVDCDIQVWVETVGNPGHVFFSVGDVKVPDCDDGIGNIGDCTFDADGNLDPDSQIVQFEVYEPVSCTPLRRHTRFDTNNDGVLDTEDPLLGIITAVNTGLPIVEWIEVNRGAMFFDADGVLETIAGGIAPVVGGSIQLEPVGCDTDGDGIPDVDEAPAACALDPDLACS